MLKKIITTFIYAVILILCGLIIFRCCANADRSTLADLHPTPELIAAMADGDMEVLKLEENASEIAPDGYFNAYAFRWIPEVGQLQVTVRYNVSTYEYLGLPEDTVMAFYLCRDEDVTTLREPDVVVDADKSLYRYKKLIWNDVDLGDSDWQVYMDRLDGEYSIAPIRYAQQEYRVYKPSGKEMDALGK